MKSFDQYLESSQEIGYVEKITSSIIHIGGLPGAKPGELVISETGKFGQVLSLNSDFLEVLIFSAHPPQIGERATRTEEFLKISIGFELLGNVIDPLGNSIETLKIIKKSQTARPIYKIPAGITERKTITKQIETGVSIVDLVLPLGCGQRQLIIGDRKTGKTSFLVQVVLTQAKQENICIYAAIGKKMLDIKGLKEFFVKHNIMKNIIIVASGSHQPAGIIHITPYSAMTIAEYFRDQGRDVLLILDDLTTHAKFYREISLLGRRFPGRNSYPGDIFYTHASLLERAGNFATANGEKAITCLPVVETTQGDLSGYIQTNLMSMTDGHLYFDSDLFAKGRRPAINPFLSVTRVGRQTQSVIQRGINREVLSFLTLFEKMQSFVHFGAELNETTKVTMSFGEAIIKFFQHSPGTSIPINVQIFLFCLLWDNIIQRKPATEVELMQNITKAYQTRDSIRKVIDGMIQSVSSYNLLLGKVSKDAGKIVDRIKQYDN